jgi:hypothetical protein
MIRNTFIQFLSSITQKQDSTFNVKTGNGANIHRECVSDKENVIDGKKLFHGNEKTIDLILNKFTQFNKWKYFQQM